MLQKTRFFSRTKNKTHDISNQARTRPPAAIVARPQHHATSFFRTRRRVQRAYLPTDPVVHAFHGPHGRGGVSCPSAGRGRWPRVGPVPRGNHNRLGRRYDGQPISLPQPKWTRMRVRKNLCPEDITWACTYFFCCSSTNYACSRKK